MRQTDRNLAKVDRRKARASSGRQDVHLSVAPQLRTLGDYARKNSYMVTHEFVDEVENVSIADRPQLRKMIDEATKVLPHSERY